MKIYTDSWHYILLRKWWGADGVPGNLCWYFWKTMLTLLLIVFAVCMGLGVLFILSYPLSQLWMGTDPGMAFASALLWMVIGSCLLTIYREEWRYGAFDTSSIWHKRVISLHTAQRARHSLPGEYLRAVKNKVCPLIEIEEKDDV